jgi:hypothetical protein
MVTGVIGTVKQHPIATAATIGASIAGVGLALAGARRARRRWLQSDQDARDEESEMQARRGEGDEGVGANEGGGTASRLVSRFGSALSRGASGFGQAASTVGDAARRGATVIGHATQEGASTVGDVARRGASAVGDVARRGASALGEAASEGYKRGREIGSQGWENHPLLLCATALAVGAAAGALLPTTRGEARVIGDAAGNLTRRLKGASRDLLDQGREVVTEAADAVSREAERQGLTPGRLGRKARRIATHVRDAVADVVGED